MSESSDARGSSDALSGLSSLSPKPTSEIVSQTTFLPPQDSSHRTTPNTYLVPLPTCLALAFGTVYIWEYHLNFVACFSSQGCIIFIFSVMRTEHLSWPSSFSTLPAPEAWQVCMWGNRVGPGMRVVSRRRSLSIFGPGRGHGQKTEVGRATS
jgi:hypothetical protein